MEQKKKFAIIGCGGIANAAHYWAYDCNQDARLVAFCDIVIEKAYAAADRFGVSRDMCFESYEELFDKVELDAVDICTPNYLHSIIAVAALNRGINVICEKPDAVSVGEALKMKEAAEKNGKTLMVMRNNRYRPESAFLILYIEDGKMGEIYTARCAWVRRRGIPGKGGWFTTKAQSGGGPLIDLGVHMIDLAIWLMGNPRPVAVSGATYCKFAENDAQADSVHAQFGEKCDSGTFDVEDLAMGFIRFENGAVMQIEFSWASNIEKENAFVELRGTKSGAVINTMESIFKIFGEENGVTTDIVPHVTEMASGHVLNIKHFAAVLQGKEKPGFVPQQGIDVIAILEAMYRSAESGREILL